jgi:integrase
VGTVFRKTFTKPLPAGAEIIVRKGERFARWKDHKGKQRTAAVTVGKDGSERVILETPYFVAKYRDGANRVREVATGCRDETAARQVLADLERKAELVRSKVITAAEAAIGDHQAAPFGIHVDAYLAHLEAKGACKEHRAERSRQLLRLATDCAFGQLADLRRESLERWLAAQARAGMGARTRNSYLCSALAFCNWCVETSRLIVNPFGAVAKANEKADPRRQRRAMTEPELVQLLAVARQRPLLDALTVRKGPRKGERYADVRPEVRARLELLGRERALIYKTLLLTGLRKGELASLTVAHLRLDAVVLCFSLDAADEKNREGNDIPLRDDLAADLRDWLADKLHRLQEGPLTRGAPIPAGLPPDTPLFDVPHKLCKILNRDLRLAGIPKRDDRGRVLDVHALRHTFGTMLSRGGVAPRTAQAAMRHSKIDLTMNVYTDPALLDVRGALDALPLLPLTGDPAEREAARATGTQGDFRQSVCLLAPTLAPDADNPVQTVSISGKTFSSEDLSRNPGTPLVNSSPVNTKGRLSSADNRPGVVGATGLEPVTPSVSILDSFWPKKSGKALPLFFYRGSRSFASTVERLRVIASKHRILRSRSVVLRSGAGAEGTTHVPGASAGPCARFPRMRCLPPKSRTGFSSRPSATLTAPPCASYTTNAQTSQCPRSEPAPALHCLVRPGGDQPPAVC